VTRAPALQRRRSVSTHRSRSPLATIPRGPPLTRGRERHAIEASSLEATHHGQEQRGTPRWHRRPLLPIRQRVARRTVSDSRSPGAHPADADAEGISQIGFGSIGPRNDRRFARRGERPHSPSRRHPRWQRTLAALTSSPSPRIASLFRSPSAGRSRRNSSWSAI
jgi:hypothetical protein